MSLKENTKKIGKYAAFFLLGALCAGAWFIWIKDKTITPASPAINIAQLRLGQKTGSFINPLLACDVPAKGMDKRLEPVKKKIGETIKSILDKKTATRISVYFRDLDSGRWTGVNYDDKYIPASLIKVPLLISYYKQADVDSKILDKKIYYPTGTDEDEGQEIIKPPTPLRQGKQYPVNELLYRMIAYSGNNSYLLLAQQLYPDFQKKIYDDLGLSYPEIFSSPALDTISPRSYAVFFRVLYNSTYLSAMNSERALDLLNQTIFKDGLVAGVPSGTAVAHKFGERTIYNQDTGQIAQRELHDCGIIYYPEHPYILCVMTQGMDYDELKSAIADISQNVYEQADELLKTED